MCSSDLNFRGWHVTIGADAIEFGEVGYGGAIYICLFLRRRVPSCNNIPTLNTPRNKVPYLYYRVLLFSLLEIDALQSSFFLNVLKIQPPPSGARLGRSPFCAAGGELIQVKPYLDILP